MKLAAALLLLAGAAPADRKAVLDALRPAIETKLGGKVEFVVQVIRVENGWAFVMADPRRSGGKPIDGTATSTTSTTWMACASMRC